MLIEAVPAEVLRWSKWYYCEVTKIKLAAGH